MMKDRSVIIRADASLTVGTGHIMRCLIVAEGLKMKGVNASFICRENEGNLIDYIESKGFRVYSLSTSVGLSDSDVLWDASMTQQILRELHRQPDWVIVDHYGIGRDWEVIVKPDVKRLLVIDDLADRYHIADLLLDQNSASNYLNRYNSLVPEDCRLLLGPKFLLLKQAFFSTRQRLKKRDGKIDRVLVFFGGTDPTNETDKVLKALEHSDFSSISFDFIIGQKNPYRLQIEQKCMSNRQVNLHIQVENMDECIADADFALGSGGIAMWERCYLGLPSAVTIVADNQVDTVRYAEENGAIWNLGWHDQINSSHYADILHRALNSPLELREMSEKGLALMESRPDTAHNKVIEALLEEIN